MYNYLKGKLVEKTPTYVVIDVGGIGFMVNISLTTYSKIKDQENIKLFTHFAVREDAHVLYGFSDINERLIFEKLITVSGVGANTARLILSSLTTDEAYDAIVQSKADVLQGVKGIGGKTAQRIIIDLKDKLIKSGIELEIIDETHNTIREEALSGLLVLGFAKQSVEKALDKVLKSGNVSDVEGLIKEALKMM
ncbi:MAG: Holliday junction branch migration protein RuvA [Lentimicrobiaceae bacterium]|jgi:holliday junction DNA helicase RuvA|nr:Holliday junction branch migration protein RuvA [Lentimicrobiaceae bacterium]MDG1900623.1 Holliday junction branch migration protein RuvA [Bacteroidales bacterium]MDG2081364.1 Holliday junction branch migration protein RuvA [Bacteroidales bacterium]